MVPASQAAQHLLQLDNFYLTEEELANTPSRKDGVSYEDERQLRTYGCELIQEAGLLCKVPQAAMVTGQVLLHRFYCKQSLVEFDVKIAAAAACFLACKLEESQIKLRNILLVFHRIEQRRENKSLQVFDIYSREFEAAKKDIVTVERRMLKAFGFITHVEYPHKYVLHYCRLLDVDEPGLAQEVWSLANDSLRTMLCVRYKADEVACGIIYLACRRRGIPMPESEDPGPWWTLFRMEHDALVDIACEIEGLYGRPRAAYLPVSRHAQEAIRQEEAARRKQEEDEAQVQAERKLKAEALAKLQAQQAAAQQEQSPMSGGTTHMPGMSESMVGTSTAGAAADTAGNAEAGGAAAGPPRQQTSTSPEDALPALPGQNGRADNSSSSREERRREGGADRRRDLSGESRDRSASRSRPWERPRSPLRPAEHAERRRDRSRDWSRDLSRDLPERRRHDARSSRHHRYDRDRDRDRERSRRRHDPRLHDRDPRDLRGYR